MSAHGPCDPGYRTALHCTVWHCTALHCMALHCTALNFTVLYWNELHCTALHCNILHCTSLNCVVLNCIALDYTALKSTALCCTTKKNIVNLLELTCPNEENINIRHQDKSRKYAHFLTDIPHSTLTCLEVSSKGYLSTRNHTALNTLFTFMKPGIKLKTFKQNISVLSVYSSYHIWLCRSDPVFTVPPPLSPPFLDKVAPTGRGPGQWRSHLHRIL